MAFLYICLTFCYFAYKRLEFNYMSKTALKKELSGYTKEQIIEVVLDLYNSRSEVKDYFKFFLNPDSEKLFEKYKLLIDKELGRSKRGKSKTRISVIKKMIKSFESYHPDIEYIHKLYQYIILMALHFENSIYYSETFYNGFYHIVEKYLEFANQNYELNSALKYIDSKIESMMPGTRKFKVGIANTCQTFIKNKSIALNR